jgi:hypothetical protein
MLKNIWPITTIDDLRQALRSALGYIFIACIPNSAAPSVFDWIEQHYSTRVHKRVRAGSDRIAIRVRTVLGDHYPDSSISEIAAGYYRMKFEDQWGRWGASHSADWSVTTEVVNLHHLTDAQRGGRGVVLWGTSFCGTLFPKIALSRAGVSLTQLSLFDHGKSHLNSLVGTRIAQPMYCLPENQFLKERIVIPDSGNRSYLYRIGEVLQNSGCIWIACHGARNQRNLTVKLLGHTAHLPGGAPTIAMRHNAVLIPAHTKRLGRFHYQVSLAPPIALDIGVDRRETIQGIVQDYADLLGARLLEQPSSWHWSHAPTACGLVRSCK